jgi:hypothetical protein
LGRALVGQLTRIGYLLKVTIEPIGNNRGSVDKIGKGGSYVHSIRKSADFCLEEKLARVVSGYEQKRLTDLVLPKVKTGDRDRDIKGTVFQG